MCYAAPGSAQGIGRAHHHRVSDVLSKGQGILKGIDNLTGNAGFADSEHGILKLLPVLCHLYCINGSSQKLDPLLFQKARFGQFHGQVQACLTA